MVTGTLAAIKGALGACALIAGCSFGISLIATPLCRAFARSRRIVDRPDDFLKPHKKPIPYLGGVAICLGWAAGILVVLAAGRLRV